MASTPAPNLAFFGELLVRLSPPDKMLLRSARSLDLAVGGAEANVAIGLASLGRATRMISRLPANPLGQMARSVLMGAGVDCAHVAEGEGRMGLYFLTPGAGLRASEVVYDRAGSVFARASADDFDWDAVLGGATHLFLSGITPALGPVSSALAIAAAKAARARGLSVIFDGNYRGLLWAAWDSDPRATLSELVGLADIMFGNHRDIALLLGTSFDNDGEERRRAASAALFAAFPNVQVLASTARHVAAADQHLLSARVETRHRVAQTDEIAVSGIVDRIGAGDAFAAGVLHGLLRSADDLDGAAKSGLALTALKHSLPGDASLFAQGDIDAFLSGEFDVRR
ncbi:sugar kinase [Sphingomonas sp. GC_Shp_3]|uniref:sugar kinase n=1 Tax=Sphingomonas sp. GC_Shp_3 TaxID=2937383 RepID=UPI00226A122B|nr:sugar kinase [Sphingomonas sp. GC_Shp_3]